jgi:S-(hydroxymethyl)mycothiol dehydrogenase
VLVGVPTPEMTVELPAAGGVRPAGALKSSWYGDCLPERDFPLLVDLWQQGRFALDRFVTERSGSTTSRRRSHRMERGEVLRSVVVLDAGASQ